MLKQAVILAGGRGACLAPVTYTVPKPMALILVDELLKRV